MTTLARLVMFLNGPGYIAMNAVLFGGMSLMFGMAFDLQHGGL